jgi:hypothetical protein
MVLGCGSQSCVRIGEKAGQSYQKSGGETHRISFEHVSTPSSRGTPEAFHRHVVTLVEQCLDRFDHGCLFPFWR